MGWAVFQAIIIFAVVATNIHWQWTPNGYLASMIGIGCAFLCTLAVNSVLWRVKAWRNRRIEQRAGQSQAAFISGQPRSIRRLG